MKYVNANLVLPEELLKEIQKYVHGELLYVPKRKELRKKWGEESGSRQLLRHRNNEIRHRFQEGESIEQLANCFYLSSCSIKKIVYISK
jgi:hypothetical protein